MHRYVVDLQISAAELLRYYRGTARDGVRGTFSLSVNAGNRLQRIERLG
jgi:hypothetical protein